MLLFLALIKLLQSHLVRTCASLTSNDDDAPQFDVAVERDVEKQLRVGIGLDKLNNASVEVEL